MTPRSLTLLLASTFLGMATPLAAELPNWSYTEQPRLLEAAGPPPPSGADLAFALDDGTAEGAFGIGGTAARQFLWFQRFSPAAANLDLQEIRVLFPRAAEIDPGAPVQLVVFQDIDGDPTTGAQLLYAADEVVEVADGATFSVYPLIPAVGIRGGGDVLIGVVNRWVVSGVTPLHEPAALDTSAPDDRSWVATWTGDPPDPPLLPSDEALFEIGQVVAGDWMIRAYASQTPVVAIPAVGGPGLVLLASLLALMGWRNLR